MGGLGSGRHGSRRKAEDCFKLDVNELRRWGCLEAGYDGGINWTRHGRNTGGVNIWSNGFELLLSYSSGGPLGGARVGVEQWVQLEQVPCTKGSTRSYFLCAGHPNGNRCNRRVGKLFLARDYFLCRHCQSISYTSQSEIAHDRLIRKGHTMRMALGGEPGLFRKIPKRPKGMHRRTYLRRISELQHTEEKVRVSMPSNLVDLLDELHLRWDGVSRA